MHLIDADSDAELDKRCLALTADQARTLADVPSLLEAANVGFSSLPKGKTVALELTVWGTATGCPRGSASSNDAALTHFGRTAALTLDGTLSAPTLTVGCVHPLRCGVCTGSTCGCDGGSCATCDGGACMGCDGGSCSPTPRCDLYASPSGADLGGMGTEANPFQTVGRLWAALQSGQTGCLKNGTYAGPITLSRGGDAGAPITLTSAPGGRATITDRFIITDSADDIVIDNLVLNGKNSGNAVSPHIFGDRITIRRCDITSQNASPCLYAGDAVGSSGYANDFKLIGNRIYDCGGHGMSLNGTNQAIVSDNTIYNNGEFGIQLYPDAFGTTIEHNVIDGNVSGIHFGGTTSKRSSGNIVSENIISNSSPQANVTSFWDATAGTGNQVNNNCVWNGAAGNFGNNGGFTNTNNLNVDPQYVNRAAFDFTVPPQSPCAFAAPKAVP